MSGHTHAPTGLATDRRYLWIALGLILALMVGEIAVAVLSGSLALLSDAGHMLTDAAALAMALLALSLTARPASGRWTYGLRRAEILSGAINGISLLLIGVLIGVEAIRRLVSPPEVAGIPVVVVALIGVAVNLGATWSLARANRSSLNIEGAFQHVLTDLYGFAATAIAGLVIVLVGWQRADPVASLVVVALMLRAAWGLLRDSGRILLEAAPEGLDLDRVRDHLRGIEHVHDVHDLHAWTVTSNLPALSAHVVIDDTCFRDGHAPQLLDDMQECLSGHFDVAHSTFQLEPAGHGEHEFDTH